MARRLRYNIGWTLFGNTSFAAAQWAIIVVIARLGSPEMVGSYSLALAITTPVFMLANLNLRAFQATDIEDAYGFDQYLGLRLAACVVAVGLVGFLCLLGAIRSDHVAVVLTVTGAKVFETISDAYYGLFQRHEEMDRIARSLLLRGGLGLAGMAGGLMVYGSLEAGAAGLGLAWLLVLALSDAPGGRQLVPWSGPRLNRGAIGLVRKAAPLGLVMLMLAVSQNIPIYAIEYLLGTEQVGFYASVAYFLVAGRIVSTAVSQASSPRLARFLLQRDSNGFRRLLRVNLLVGLAIAGGGTLVSMLIGEPLLGLVYGRPYAQHGMLLTCIMAAAGLGFIAAFLGAALTAARRFRAMVATNAVALAMTGVICMWAIPRFDLLGAPLAIGLAVLTKVIINLIVIEDYLRHLQADASAVGDQA